MWVRQEYFGLSRMIWKDSVEVSAGGIVERFRWFAEALVKGCISEQGSEGTMQGHLKWCEGINIVMLDKDMREHLGC